MLLVVPLEFLIAVAARESRLHMGLNWRNSVSSKIIYIYVIEPNTKQLNFFQGLLICILSVDGATYDYVVIGGGTAGAVVAARLVEANSCVLMIEAGDIPGADSLVSKMHIIFN